MKLSNIAILAVKGLSKEAKQRIADSIEISLDSLYRNIRENSNNGDLTKIKALQAIGEETGLDQSQILEQDMDNQNESVSDERATKIES